MKFNQIVSNLSEIPDCWTIDTRNISTEDFFSVQHFFDSRVGQDRKNPKPSHPKSRDLPYHQSLFHFLTYYAYYPKIPFILKKYDNIIFGSFYGHTNRSLELSFPFNRKMNVIFREFIGLLNDYKFGKLLKKLNVSKILLRDIPDEIPRLLNRIKNVDFLKLKTLTELYYYKYDLIKTLNKRGKRFSNLRGHLNNFKKSNHKIEVVDICNHRKHVVHLIGNWKHSALGKRGFSYVNVKSDKQAVRLFGNPPEPNPGVTGMNKEMEINSKMVDNKLSPTITDSISRVLKIDGEVASFNFGYPVGIYRPTKFFAHAVGISDISIPHLAEYAQYDFWKEIQRKGFRYVNDGPSWRNSLRTYKRKFRPIGKRRFYYAVLSCNI